MLLGKSLRLSGPGRPRFCSFPSRSAMTGPMVSSWSISMSIPVTLFLINSPVDPLFRGYNLHLPAIIASSGGCRYWRNHCKKQKHQPGPGTLALLHGPRTRQTLFFSYFQFSCQGYEAFVLLPSAGNHQPGPGFPLEDYWHGPNDAIDSFPLVQPVHSENNLFIAGQAQVFF